MQPELIVDRRSRPQGTERRNDPNPAPKRGLHGTKVARGQAGRRATDPKARVWPVPMPGTTISETFDPDTATSYRMPSGQLIRVD